MKKLLSWIIRPFKWFFTPKGASGVLLRIALVVLWLPSFPEGFLFGLAYGALIVYCYYSENDRIAPKGHRIVTGFRGSHLFKTHD